MSLFDTKNNFGVLIKPEEDGVWTFMLLIAHPMEYGLNRNKKTGEIIPEDYVEWVSISIDNKPCFEMALGMSVSQNPYVKLSFGKSLLQKKVLDIYWRDNHGNGTAHTIPIKFSEEKRMLHKYVQ